MMKKSEPWCWMDVGAFVLSIVMVLGLVFLALHALDREAELREARLSVYWQECRDLQGVVAEVER